jgi:hypothetical protein
VRVSYFNPRTEQRVEVSMPIWDAGNVPEEAGSEVALEVSRHDPGTVRAMGDRFPLTYNVVGYLLLPAGALVAWIVRRIGTWRTERFMARAAQSFAMVGAVSPPRRWGRFCHLHLWPLDAEPSASALCALPLVSTAGLPIGGPAFPVEVKGSPRAMGRVVSNTSAGVVWPAGRAAMSTWMPRPSEVAEVETVAPVAPPAVVVPPSWRAWLGTVAVLWVLAGIATAVVALVGGIVVVNGDRAERLGRDGVSVIATVVGYSDADDAVDVTYRAPGTGDVTEARAPVDYGSDYPEGRRYPARVDLDDPSRVRLEAEPYDAFEPMAWAAAALVLVLVLLGRRALAWRALRAVARGGPWYAMAASRVGSDDKWVVALGPRRGGGVVCTLRFARDQRPPVHAGVPVEVVVAADRPEPGTPVAVTAGGAHWPVVGAARAGLR